MGSNIRTLKFLGIDDFSNPVYTCLETKTMYKDLSMGEDEADLYTCGNRFDGDPAFPINDKLVVTYANPVGRYVEPKNSADYQMLGRLMFDCDRYISDGCKNENLLWAKSVEEHLKEMWKIYNSFDEKGKPQWLPIEKLQDYEEAMKGVITQ